VSNEHYRYDIRRSDIAPEMHGYFSAEKFLVFASVRLTRHFWGNILALV
jgi:hypothetical protein